MLTPQTTSTRGRDGSGGPVLLVNGRRISGFQEIQGIPPEAIERFQILPEEVALSYGYKADQRVVNIILKKNYNALMTQAQATVATDGGRVAPGVGGNRVHISCGDRRWNLDVQLSHDPYLLEKDRDIIRSPNGQPFDLVGNVSGLNGGEIDPALSALAGKRGDLRRRARLGAGRQGQLGGLRLERQRLQHRRPDARPVADLAVRQGHAARATYSRDLNKQTQLTLSGNLEDTSSRALLGLPGVTFTLPAGSPFSPFSNAVTGYRYIDAAGAMARDIDASALPSSAPPPTAASRTGAGT
ncbi:hypothetical protein ACRAWD_24575 [Caulobacter segnis]